jgi:hypothetical protein
LRQQSCACAAAGGLVLQREEFGVVSFWGQQGYKGSNMGGFFMPMVWQEYLGEQM